MENSNPFDLLSTKMCSPLVVFVVIFTLTALCVYLTRGRLKRFGNQKMDNLADLYSMQELKFYVFLGITLYGLCQYEQTSLAWIFLMLPLVYIGLKNIFISTFVTVAEQNVPQPVQVQPALQNIGSVSPQVEQALLQTTVKQNQQNQFQQMQQPLDKTINLNKNTPSGSTAIGDLNNYSTF
jgi:hypothetical protein